MGGFVGAGVGVGLGRALRSRGGVDGSAAPDTSPLGRYLIVMDHVDGSPPMAGLRFGTVASVIVMDYSGLFWATLYGWALFAMLPPASTWLGAPLIVAAGLIIAWHARLAARRPASREPKPARSVSCPTTLSKIRKD